MAYTVDSTDHHTGAGTEQRDETMSVFDRVRAKAEEIFGRATEVYGESHGDAAAEAAGEARRLEGEADEEREREAHREAEHRRQHPDDDGLAGAR